jgi:hypothetical protein
MRICPSHFRYLYGREGQYELYGENAYEDLIEPELPDFVSETFESLCHQALPALNADYQLTQVPSQWWYKGREVDVVAPTDESTLIAGEATFTSAPLSYDVLSDLEDDVAHIDWTPTGGGEPTYEFALFSRSGFKRSVEEAADERADLRLFDLSDIVAVLERSADD